MNDKNSFRKRSSRLSIPVRMGVAAIAACFIAAPVLSNPVNPAVVHGAATFNQAGSVLTVTNSNGAIINWDKFSIQTGETTRFAQTAASSTVLNRVLNDPTAIYGTLSSNGRVWLVNPAGIMVGPGGRVDTAGFVASTLGVSNENFLAGRRLFVNDGTAKDVINQGEIRTPAGGSVYLIGANVSNERIAGEPNSGIISTPGGETILAAGATVSLIDSAIPGVKVDITGAAGNSTNLGSIAAEAGRIGIAGVIVRNSGILNASSVVNDGGRIFLRASRDAYVDGDGRIVTTGAKGGSVEVLGNRVAVMDNASIDASGANGGGRIMVGGDYQGKNLNLQNANITYFGPNASLKADATEVGAGGTVIVWADDTTRAYGNISARGGALGGDGGFVETSGHRYLDANGARVDTRSTGGRSGAWLLDPTDITIVHSVYGGADVNISGSSPFQAPSGNVSQLSDFTVNAGLVGGDVMITTASSGTANGDIKLLPGVAITNTSGIARLLTLDANHDIVFGDGTAGAISFSGSYPLDIRLGAGASGKIVTVADTTLTLNGVGGALYVASVYAGKTWENHGTISLQGVSAIDLDPLGAGTSVALLENKSNGTIILDSTQGWAIQSNSGSQNGDVENEGLIEVLNSTAIEAKYSQSSTGTLHLIGAGTVVLSLQNLNQVEGTVNFTTSDNSPKLLVSENHGSDNLFLNTAITGTTGGIEVSGSGVNSWNHPIATFTNVNSTTVPLTVGAYGGVSINGGTSVFKTVTLGGNGLTSMTNGTLGVATGNFTVPGGVSYTGDVGYLAAGDLSLNNSMTIPGTLKLMAGWDGNIGNPGVGLTGTVTVGNGGTVTVTAGTIAVEAGLGVTLGYGGGVSALASSAGQTTIRTGTGGLTLPGGSSISSSSFVELSPSGDAVDMCVYGGGTCAAEFSLDPSILVRVFPADALILGRPVADTSYTGKLSVLSDIPSAVVNGAKLALNGYDVEIFNGANIGTTGVPFDKPLDILANHDLTVTGNVVLGSTRNLAMSAGQSVAGLLDLNFAGALVYGANITLNNPSGAISGVTTLETPGTLSALAYGGISLTGNSNQVATFTASNTGINGIEFHNAGGFNLGAVANSAPGEGIAVYGGNSITQIGNLSTYGGPIWVSADIDLVMNSGTQAQSYGGLIHYETSLGSVQLGLLYAGTGNVQVVAGTDILDGNGTANNIKASAADLTTGAIDDGLSASINVDTQVSSLNVDNTVGFVSASTMAVRNSGFPLAVNVVADPLTGQLTVTNNNTINVVHIGGAANTTLTANGAASDITIEGAGTLLADGNIVLNAGRDILVVHDYVQSFGGTVTATAGRNISISSTGFSPAQSYIRAANGINLTMLTGGLTIDGTATYPAYISTTAGDINIATGTGFNNVDVTGNGANGALDAPSGRWLIYAPNPSLMSGTPAYDFKQYNTAFGGAIQGAGNGVIYTLAPVISLGLTGPVTKVYDGTNAAILTAANYGGVTGMVDGDTVAVAGNPSAATYNTKNVGTGKKVTVGGMTINATNTTAAAYGGNAQVYGYLFSGTASGDVGIITPRDLNLSGLTAQNKVYDGNTAATLLGTFSGLIAGDVVSLAPGTGVFADRHVGTGKTVNISGLALFGQDAGNYTLAPNTTSSTTANITQRASVNWVGGVGTNWSTAANWEGGALPDRANVAAVTLGSGAVTYDYSNLSVDAPILNSLTLAGGTLTLSNATLTVPTWMQTEGNLRGAGGLTVSQSMTMDGLGTIDIGGPVTIHHDGDLQLGRIKTAKALSVTATGTLSGTTAAGTWQHTAGSIALDAFGIGAANDMLQTRTGFLTVINHSGNAWIHNTGLVNLTGSSVGGFHLESVGGIVTGGPPVKAGGVLKLIAHSPIIIGSGGVQGGTGVVLRADTPDPSNSSILISGPVSAPGGTVVVAAYNDVTQNADITGGNVSVGSAAGSIQMAATARTQATSGNVSYDAPSGSMTLASIDAGSGSVNLDAGGSIAATAGSPVPNITGAGAHITAGGSLQLTTEVTLLDVDVVGSFSITNGDTAFSSLPPINSSTDQTSKDLDKAVNSAVTDQTPTGGNAPLPDDATKPDRTRPSGDLSKTVGGTEGSFGGDEKKEDKDKKKSDDAKDEKKDEKPVAKKVAQCSA